MKPINPFNLDQLLAWLAAVLITGVTGTVGLISWANNNFQSKEEAKIIQNYTSQSLEKIEKSMDRLDNKLDFIIKHRR